MVPCSWTYANQALRTLKAMPGKTEEWKLLERVPIITSLKADGRDRLVDAESESKFHEAHHQPMNDIRRLREQACLFLVILQETGMRPDEVWCSGRKGWVFPSLRCLALYTFRRNAVVN
ncbi:hypothetical protein FTW19_16530 [Terriglobus albidus]|uniref:Tyr recombinase domain-containing protein n=1 Tax=Terriglobus albidus TaxID=1592106 RepID=A0A5B9EF72_9BACT|nr:hypothetical protein [Terriglobus albidus]QEE29460.1 hypothetical protein FTW19_16530 [Terriglobus albidus]